MWHEPAPACEGEAAVGRCEGQYRPYRRDLVVLPCALWCGRPYLFGAFSAVDAMFAPVVHRFRIYAIEVSSEARAYMDTMQANPAFRQWTEEGLAETLLIPRFEEE